MATTTFGKRGAAASPLRQAAPVRAPQPIDSAPALTREEQYEQFVENLGQRSLIAHIPLLTVAMIALLAAIFMLQRATALDMGAGGEMSLETLLAQGAASRELVFGNGEWWRIFLAPLLHGSNAHLYGNGFALLIVGSRLEPWISRGWFAAIFAVSALGGIAGSLAGNPHMVPTVGASGAITGVIAALFVLSFHNQEAAEYQSGMRRAALFFGVPALLPLVFGASGGTDYFAHLGGALAGGALAFALGSLWSQESRRPAHVALAVKIALGALAASLVSTGFAAAQYSSHAARAAEQLPMAAVPADLGKIDAKAFDLYARYPKDPRAHLFRAVYQMRSERLDAAEHELRTAMQLAERGGFEVQPVGKLAKVYLALVLGHEGRRSEARELAREGCGGQRELREELAKAKLCG